MGVSANVNICFEILRSPHSVDPNDNPPKCYKSQAEPQKWTPLTVPLCYSLPPILRDFSSATAERRHSRTQDFPVNISLGEMHCIYYHAVCVYNFSVSEICEIFQCFSDN